VWLAPLAALLFVIVALARQRATRMPAVGLALALVAALPSSPMAHPINEQADRYLFLSVLGGGAVWGFAFDRASSAISPRLRTVALVLACLPLVLVAQRAEGAWQSEAQLWRVATERAPDSPRAWAGLSRTYRLRGDLDRADAAAERAVALDPSYSPAHLTRAYGALARGDLEKARVELDAVRGLGGAHQPGARHAIDCAARGPSEARACIDATP
jgi:tetratricopeptide (TPR) repeat protein